MKNPTFKTKTLVFAGALIVALTCVFQPAHADRQLDSARSDGDVSKYQGPPQSIAFHSNSIINPNGSRNFEVYLMNPDGMDQTRITFDERNDQQPNISPNGRQIIFASSRITETNLEGNLEIFVMDIDGGNIRQLTFTVAGISNAQPRWSPSGRQIVFHSNMHGNFEIYLINPDGTELTRVTEYPGVDMFPEWSPNGKQLAILRDMDIYLIDLDGTNPIQLTENVALNQMASWSPNGKQIAFMSGREGYCSVFVMNSDGSDQTNLTPKPDGIPNNQFCSRAPAWSRNGKHIYFSSRRPGTNSFENIFVMNYDGGDVTQLTFDASLNSVATVR